MKEEDIQNYLESKKKRSPERTAHDIATNIERAKNDFI